jgi:hypothetical protein
MNAYELADELKRCIDDGSTDLVCVCSAVNMLRQQADRIERKRELIREQTALLVKQNNRIAELEKGGEIAGRFYWESVVDGHVMAVPSEGTPHYNKDDFPLYTTPQIKELSDEEIEQIAIKWYVGSRILPIGFARAILKKASEK